MGIPHVAWCSHRDLRSIDFFYFTNILFSLDHPLYLAIYFNGSCLNDITSVAPLSQLVLHLQILHLVLISRTPRPLSSASECHSRIPPAATIAASSLIPHISCCCFMAFIAQNLGGGGLSLKKLPFLQGTLGKPFNELDSTRTLQRARPIPLKSRHLFALKCLI